jgi:hypothetical protein
MSSHPVPHKVFFLYPPWACKFTNKLTSRSHAPPDNHAYLKRDSLQFCTRNIISAVSYVEVQFQQLLFVPYKYFLHMQFMSFRYQHSNRVCPPLQSWLLRVSFISQKLLTKNTVWSPIFLRFLKVPLNSGCFLFTIYLAHHTKLISFYCSYFDRVSSGNFLSMLILQHNSSAVPI